MLPSTIPAPGRVRAIFTLPVPFMKLPTWFCGFAGSGSNVTDELVLPPSTDQPSWPCNGPGAYPASKSENNVKAAKAGDAAASRNAVPHVWMNDLVRQELAVI